MGEGPQAGLVYGALPCIEVRVGCTCSRFLDVARALGAEYAGTGGQGEVWEKGFLGRTFKLD